MALVTLGALTLQVADSSQQPQPPTFERLQQCGAAIVDGENDPLILALAATAINHGISNMNMRYLFHFERAQSTGIALVDGTGTITLPADFFAIKAVQLVDTNGDEQVTLPYLPWDQWITMDQKQTRTGTPEFFTTRNTFDDANIILYPTPDATAAATYTVTVTYHNRVPQLAALDDVLDAPIEIWEPLCHYAEWYILRHKDRNNVPLIKESLYMYESTLRSFQWSDNRVPTDHETFQIDWYGSASNLNTDAYIKLD